MGCKAVIFDLDGTLLKLRFRVKEARRALIAGVKETGFDVSNLSELRPTQLIYDAVAEQIEHEKVDITLSEAKRMMSRILDEFELQGIHESELNHGVVDALKWMKGVGLRLAIVTNEGVKAVNLILSRHELHDYFDTVVTRNDVERMKPSGDGLARALKMIEVQPSEAIFVGDSVLDIDAAQSAGVRAVSIPGGAHPLTALLEAKPDYVVASPSDLVELLAHLKECKE